MNDGTTNEFFRYDCFYHEGNADYDPYPEDVIVYISGWSAYIGTAPNYELSDLLKVDIWNTVNPPQQTTSSHPDNIIIGGRVIVKAKDSNEEWAHIYDIGIDWGIETKANTITS